MNTFINNDHVVQAGDFIIDVMCRCTTGVEEYIDILSNYGLESMIDVYTREEYAGDKVTKTCIDDIIVRTCTLIFIVAIIKQKVADHYFVALKFMREVETKRSPGK